MGNSHGKAQEPLDGPHGEPRGNGSWCAGLPWHLETEDQPELGPWWCHSGLRPSRNSCGHCDDFRAEGKEACGGQLGIGLKGKWQHSQRAIEKEVGSDRMPFPCQCILSQPGALLGGWFHLRFLLFHLLNPDPGLSRADPWACAPTEQGDKWECKILNQRPQTRSHWCVLCGLHCS